MSATVQPPREDCPNCGDPAGFLWADEGDDAKGFAKPRYNDLTRRLVWTCRTCWFEVLGPTADVS